MAALLIPCSACLIYGISGFFYGGRNEYWNCRQQKTGHQPKSDKLLKFTLHDGTPERRVILSGIKKYYDPAELVGKTAVAITNLPPRKMMGEYSNGMLISAVNEYDGEEMLNLLLVDDRIPAGAKLY